jgi:hypothetical protein
MGQQTKATKKVISVELARDRNGELEIFNHQGTDLYSSIVTFGDQSKGTFKHPGMTQTHFISGKDAEFTAENMGTWWKLRKAGGGGKGGGGGGRPGGWIAKTGAEIKRDSISFTAGYVKDLVIAGKTKIEDYGKILEQLQAAVNEEIDKIKD